MTERELELNIAVGSQNKAKNLAVKTAFERAFPGYDIKTHGFDVESGVSEQPLSNEETLDGAMNRAKNAGAQLASHDYAVGLEGGIVKVNQAVMLVGWVAIYGAGSQEPGVGHSGGVLLPGRMADALFAGEELGPLLQEMLGDEDNAIRHTLGTNGILSNGLYTREQEFIDAATAALARFVSPKLYQ